MAALKPDACPLCGNALHGWAQLADPSAGTVFACHCARCGRFAVTTDLAERIAQLDQAERSALSTALVAAGSHDARGVHLQAPLLSRVLEGRSEKATDP